TKSTHVPAMMTTMRKRDATLSPAHVHTIRDRHLFHDSVEFVLHGRCATRYTQRTGFLFHFSLLHSDFWHLGYQHGMERWANAARPLTGEGFGLACCCRCNLIDE